MNETMLFGAIGAATVGLAALGSLIFTRVRNYRRGNRMDTKLATDSSAATGTEAAFARYQPLFRLLTGEDADFVRKHQTCQKAAARWKQSQRRVVRLYLRELAADFQTLHRQARALAAQSPAQYDHLIPLLFKQQVVFWRALLWIDLRISLGSNLPNLNPEALENAFEAVRREFAQAAATQHRQPA